ncbi:MAG: FAD-dependent monooxygenase [Eubacteriales bacterium]
MPIIVKEIKLPLDSDDNSLLKAAAKKLSIDSNRISRFRILKQSVDARKKTNVHFSYTLYVYLKNAKEEEGMPGFEMESLTDAQALPTGENELHERPIIVGAGPCGIFCASLLSEYGFKPIVIERGSEMAKRESQFNDLKESGKFLPESNVCFGEGGAGTFSDGKLTTRIKDKRVLSVLEKLVKAGAPKEITYLAHPHVGTENIRKAIVHLRRQAIKAGAEFRFDTKLKAIKADANQSVSSVILEDKNAKSTENTKLLIAALGSSARDTIYMLYDSGIFIQKKPFAIGVRIEHKRELIDKVQYGEFFSNPRLGAAEYRLSKTFNGRGVYTFCMCPGGEVINSSCEEMAVSVNGMSHFARDMENSNSAVVVTVNEEDMDKSPLSGIELTRKWEKVCFDMAKGYGAPASRLEDFLIGRAGKHFGAIKPSIKPYAKLSNVSECLPDFITHSLCQGIKAFGKSFRGFDDGDAVLTAIESKTSSPVRILRGEDYQSVSLKGFFPAGEGAGYAGGIVSAAVDGLKIAEYIIRNYKPCY